MRRAQRSLMLERRSPIKILSLGDSITLGSSPYVPAESYRVAALESVRAQGFDVEWAGSEKHASQTYYHLGKSGHYVHEIEDEIDNHCDDYEPQVVIVNGGTNNIHGSQTPATIEAAMESCIETIRSLPAVHDIILTDVPIQPAYTSESVAYNALLAALANSYPNVRFAPIFASVQLDGSGTPQHPTTAGYLQAGRALAGHIAKALQNPSTYQGRSPLTLSSRQLYATTAIRDFWISVYDEEGALGQLYEDASNTDPVEDGDDVNSVTDLINSTDWNELVNAPVYRATGGPNGQPIIDFTVSGGACGWRKSTLTFGMPCTLWAVGSFATDSIGYLFTRGVGGGAVVLWQSETSGGTEDGIGFYNGTDGHVSFAGDDGSTHADDYACWAIVYGDDNYARLYRDGVQVGSARAYTTYVPASANFDIGYLQTPQAKLSDLGGIMRAMSVAEIKAMALFNHYRFGTGAPP